MVKNKGGKGHRKSKNSSEDDDLKRMVKKEDEHQDYVRIIKMLGNRRCTGFMYRTGKEYLCVIRGNMKRRVWINSGDIVLVSTREYQDEKLDIFHKYNPKEIRHLQKTKELPPDIMSTKPYPLLDNETELDIDQCGFDFDEI